MGGESGGGGVCARVRKERGLFSRVFFSSSLLCEFGHFRFLFSTLPEPHPPPFATNQSPVSSCHSGGRGGDPRAAGAGSGGGRKGAGLLAIQRGAAASGRHAAGAPAPRPTHPASGELTHRSRLLGGGKRRAARGAGPGSRGARACVGAVRGGKRSTARCATRPRPPHTVPTCRPRVHAGAPTPPRVGGVAAAGRSARRRCFFFVCPHPIEAAAAALARARTRAAAA